MARRERSGRPRVLIVDGHFVRAMTLHGILARAGVEPVGPFGHALLARRATEAERIDGALLGTGISGEAADPVADLLTARGIPYLRLEPADAPPAPWHRLGELMRLITDSAPAVPWTSAIPSDSGLGAGRAGAAG